MNHQDEKAIHIVPFSPEYEQDIVNLIINIQQNEFGIAITSFDQPDLASIASYYQNYCGNFWVATVDKHVVGTIALLDIGNHCAALRKMFVDSSYRGRHFGIASKLLETLLAWSRHHALNKIYLGTTQKFIAAHKFYDKNGFIRVMKSELPKSFPVMAVDTVFYKYSIVK